MLKHATLDQLAELKLHGMAAPSRSSCRCRRSEI